MLRLSHCPVVARARAAEETALATSVFEAVKSKDITKLDALVRFDDCRELVGPRTGSRSVTSILAERERGARRRTESFAECAALDWSGATLGAPERPLGAWSSGPCGISEAGTLQVPVEGTGAGHFIFISDIVAHDAGLISLGEVTCR